MNLQTMEHGKKKKVQKTPKILILTLLTMAIIFIFIPFTNPLPGFTTPEKIPGKTKTPKERNSNYPRKKYCDIFSGEWVPDSGAPYYTNMTCKTIQDHQNCFLHGRPDTEFLKWRWKPDELGCELPIFDPIRFLEIVRGKSLAFVGDSLARNHMQSLLCLLSKVEDPVDVSKGKNDGSQFKRYEYRNHNFTIEIFWSPYLVKTTLTNPNDSSRFNLYLDEFDELWTTKIDNFDYVVISVGQWFFRPTMFYINNQLIGCLWCKRDNITHFPVHFGFQMAYKTAFRGINSLENYKGVTFVRTFATSHFENGEWDEGGDCARTRPYRKNEAIMDGKNLAFYNTQMEEFKNAVRLGSGKGMKFRLFDVTRAMWMRPDGHPSKYYGKTDPSWANDCVHWCLPGPIDTWNDFLLELLKREEELIIV